MALTDDTTVVYLCSAGYAPQREHTVHALDPELGIAWPTAPPASFVLLACHDGVARVQSAVHVASMR